MADGSLIVRAPAYGERRYVYSTARAFVLARYGERFADYDEVLSLVDAILDRSNLTVALFDGVLDDRGRPEIHGFCAEDTRDKSVEFFYLRKMYRDMSSPVLAGKVARGLLGERTEVVLRRGVTPEALKAIVAAGVTPVVRPRSV